jgi:hypothetical protein
MYKCKEYTIPKSQALRQHFTPELPLKIKTSPQSLPTTNSIAESLSTSPRAIAFLNTDPGHSNSKRSTKDTALILMNNIKLNMLKRKLFVKHFSSRRKK